MLTIMFLVEMFDIFVFLSLVDAYNYISVENVVKNIVKNLKYVPSQKRNPVKIYYCFCEKHHLSFHKIIQNIVQTHLEQIPFRTHLLRQDS